MAYVAGVSGGCFLMFVALCPRQLDLLSQFSDLGVNKCYSVWAVHIPGGTKTHLSSLEKKISSIYQYHESNNTSVNL